MKYPFKKQVGNFFVQLGLILFIYLTLNGCEAPEEITHSKLDAKPLPVQIGKVVIKNVVDEVHAIGNVVTDKRLTLTSEVRGVIEDMPQTTGRRMKAGDTVAVIDPREYRLQVERLEAEKIRQEKALEIAMKGQRPEELIRLEAEVEADKSSLHLAELEYDRNKNLFDEGVVSQLRLDQVENDLGTAKAELEKSLAEYQEALAFRGEDIARSRAMVEAVTRQLEKARLDLKKTVVKTPFDSILLLKLVDVGSYVKSGNQLAEIVGVTGLMAEFEIPQILYGQLHKVKRVRFHVPEMNLKFKKRITKENPFRLVTNGDIYSDLVRVQMNLDPAPDGLFHGLALEASLEFETRKNIKHVPPLALVERNDESVVYVVQDGKAQPVKVSVVNKMEDLVEIKDPARLLTPKTGLILRGSGVVYPGARVFITNPPSEQAGPPGGPPAKGKKGAA